MSKEKLILGAVILLVIFISVWEIKKPKLTAPTSPISTVTNEKEEASVTVSVTYLADKSNSQSTFFEINLDTHSVNLDDFSFEKDIFIEKGNSKVFPKNVAASGEGHHRNAQVSFTKTPAPFFIVVSRVAGIARRDFAF